MQLTTVLILVAVVCVDPVHILYLANQNSTEGLRNFSNNSNNDYCYTKQGAVS
jgi:hypothetical protein